MGLDADKNDIGCGQNVIRYVLSIHEQLFMIICFTYIRGAMESGHHAG